MATQHPIPTNPRFVDLTGKVFVRWTVLQFAGYASGGNSAWLCRCDCGTESTVRGPHLTRDISTCCGSCARTKHGLSRSPEYDAWHAMIQRCENSNNKKYGDYGGRKITVYDAWHSFEAFYRDVGPRPSPRHSLDRYPNKDGNYEPGNVRWATIKEQNRNTRSNRLLTFNGKTQSIAEWAEELGISRITLTGRILRGWSIERAITQTIQARRPS